MNVLDRNGNIVSEGLAATYVDFFDRPQVGLVTAIDGDLVVIDGPAGEIMLSAADVEIDIEDAEYDLVSFWAEAG